MKSIIALLLLGVVTRRSNAVVLGANETCEDAGLVKHFDWDVLMSNVSAKPEMSYSMGIDTANLALTLEVDLEYVGYSYAEDHTYGYGVTYVLDFEDFDAESDDIDQPGNCQNRIESSFLGSNWHSKWGYSDTPYMDGHIDSDSYLSYPTSGDVWDLTIDNETDICTPVHYSASIGWNTLKDCSNYDNSMTYTQINQDDSWINLTGVFYINVVSPLSKTNDVGFYRVYQILSAPFVIAVRNQINLISSVGINLFTLTIIAVYKEDLESDFRLIVLTEAADFLMLEHPQLLTAPSIAGLGSTFDARNYSLHDGCLTVQSNLCSQLWEIYADDVQCPPTDFTGTYGLSFQTTCNLEANYTTNATALCNDYIDTYGSDVSLTTPLNWLDEICDPEIFVIEFGGVIRFYNDSTYKHELGESDQYTVGEDRAFVEIEVSIPSTLYDIFEVSLDNVWICTTSPDNEPLAITDQALGSGGCLSVGVLDGGFPYHLIISGEDNDLTEAGDVIIYDPFNSTVQFSFDVDSSITRTNLYVQVQIGINLVQASNSTLAPGRRLLQDGPSASQTRHFDGSTALGEPSLIDDEISGSDDDIIDDDGTDGGAVAQESAIDTNVVIVSIVALIAVCLCFGGVFAIAYMRKQKGLEPMGKLAEAAAIDRKVAELVRQNTPTPTMSRTQTPCSQQAALPVAPDTPDGSVDGNMMTIAVEV